MPISGETLVLIGRTRPPKLTTDETYANNVNAQGLPVDVESFDGYKLCWIGSRDAKRVILYNCGGGLTTHCYDAHLINLINGYQTMKANGQHVAIAILAYDKSKSARGQLELRHLRHLPNCAIPNAAPPDDSNCPTPP